MAEWGGCGIPARVTGVRQLEIVEWHLHPPCFGHTMSAFSEDVLHAAGFRVDLMEGHGAIGAAFCDWLDVDGAEAVERLVMTQAQRDQLVTLGAVEGWIPPHSAMFQVGRLHAQVFVFAARESALAAVTALGFGHDAFFDGLALTGQPLLFEAVFTAQGLRWRVSDEVHHAISLSSAAAHVIGVLSVSTSFGRRTRQPTIDVSACSMI